MFTRKMIKHHMNQGKIIILPYEEEALQVNSYDVRIGNWIARFKALGMQDRFLEGKNHVSDLYSLEFCKDEIVIRAGEKILCHTQEFMGTTSGSVMSLATKSTIARKGLDVCGSAGFGDVGYVNRWTMELKNDSPNDIVIPVGQYIGQAFFEAVQPEDELVQYNGKYNNDAPQYSIIQMMKNWKPEDMLPKQKKGE